MLILILSLVFLNKKMLMLMLSIVFFKQGNTYADAFNCLFLNKKILMLMPSIGFFKKTVDKILEILDSVTGVIL